jgi:Sortase domain
VTTTAPGRGYPPALRLPQRRPDGVPAPAPGAGPPRRGRRGVGWLAVLLILLGLFATGLGLGELGGPGLPNPFGDPAQGGHGTALPRSEPTRLSIPRIQVAAPIQAVGLSATGLIEVPPLARHNTVGWYDRGPTPGQDGPAVLVGHVDTRSGPSVFAHLGDLKQGDKILVSRKDRRLAVFQVDAVRSYPKSNVPADQVYGDFSRPALRLITCGGAWVGGGTGYADNVVVYASLTDA